MDESKLPKGTPTGVFEEIHIASRNRDAGRVLGLLQAGVDANLRNRKEPNGDGGNTPLWFAAQGARPGGISVARTLLAAGARINERCEYGTTALHMAVAWGHLAMVEFLLANGADIHAANDEGRTALEMAQTDLIRMRERKKHGKISSEAEAWLSVAPSLIDCLSGVHESR
jgi:ankyrin repeat protein